MRKRPSPPEIPIQTFDMSTAALEAFFPINVPGWVVLDRAPDADILREAVGGVMAEFPALSSGIEHGWLSSRFMHGHFDPPLTIVDHDFAELESIPMPLLDFFQTPLDMTNGPLAAFFLVRTKGISFLGVNVHHGACDGRGLRYLLTALAAHYSSLAAGKKPDRPVFRTDRVPTVIFQQYSLRRRAAMVINSLKMLAGFLRAPFPDQMEAEAGGPGVFTPVFFNGEERDRIIAMTKKLGITVNDLFLAALVRAYLRWNGRISALHVLVPQDLRPWGVSAPGVYLEEGEWRTVGNMIGGILLKLSDQLPHDDADLLRWFISGLTRAEKQAETALDFASLATLPVNLFPARPLMFIYRRLSARRMLAGVLHFSTCFSNLGAAPTRQLVFGEARPLRFAFALPFIPGCGAFFTAAGLDDSISFVITHPRAMDAEKFRKIFREEVFA